MTDAVVVSQENQLTQSSINQWSALQTILNQTVPDSVVKTRPGRGGKSFKYVPHNWVTAQLNNAFGFDWDGEVLAETVRITEFGVLLFYRLEVRAGDKRVVKVEPGWKAQILDRNGNLAMELGDMVKSATSDGLRRCAMRLGLGLNLYGTEDEPSPSEVKNTLSSYAKKHLNWDARQTFDWLKEQGFSADDLVPKREAMYEALAKQAGKAGVTESFDDDEPELPTEPEPEERSDHWIEDRSTQRKFWGYVKKLGIEQEQAREALGVESIKDYRGTRQNALTALRQYARDTVTPFATNPELVNLYFAFLKTIPDGPAPAEAARKLAPETGNLVDFDGTLTVAMNVLWPDRPQ